MCFSAIALAARTSALSGDGEEGEEPTRVPAHPPPWASVTLVFTSRRATRILRNQAGIRLRHAPSGAPRMKAGHPYNMSRAQPCEPYHALKRGVNTELGLAVGETRGG